MSADAITASFSTGFMEHVEYTIRPPFCNILMARCNILDWRLAYRQSVLQEINPKYTAYPCRPLPSIGDQCFHIPGFFLIVPSPLHGTSHNIRSKSNCCCLLVSCEPAGVSKGILMAGNIDASWFVTISAGEGSRADWCMSMCVRLLSLSLAMTKPDGTDEAVTVSCA